MSHYPSAREQYAALGVDTEAALETLAKTPISLHCWQGDDVGGFEKAGSKLEGGGIQATGNYPGKARTIEELRADLDKALALIPGKHRLNVHACYADLSGGRVDRDAYTIAQFQSWVDWCKAKGLGMDFNPSYFSHPLAADGLTLTHPDKKIREFWIQHGIACRKIGAEIAKQLGSPVVTNVWIPDGSKDMPYDRKSPRERLAAYQFPTATAESLGILIRSQAAIQGDRYVFSERQVNAILELRLYQLTGMERDKVKAEYDGVLVDIKDLLDILAREVRVLTIIKDELSAIRDKHATPRKCPILAEAGEVAIEDLIANDAMIVTLSHRGYVKRTPATEYRLQGRGGKGLKGMETKSTAKGEPDDFVEHLFSVQAHDYLMFFTNTGRVYVERVYELPEGSRTSTGRSIRNVLNLKPEEKIAAMLRLERTTDEANNDITFREDAGFVFFATRSGKVKKTALNDFRNYRKDGIIAIILEENNELIGVRLTSGSDEIILVTHEGLSLRFHEEDTRSQGRASMGVMGIRPRDEDFVVGLALATADSTLLVASENGLGKRTSFEEYRLQGRGGKGIITMKTNDKTGAVAGALTVRDDDELMLITNKGKMVRTRISEIRETGRNAQGVKLIDLRANEVLQAIAPVVSDEEDAEETAPPAE